MRITISGKNLDITEGLRSAVEEKLSRLEKYFTPDTIVNVTLSVTKKTPSEDGSYHTDQGAYYPRGTGKR